jgi:hypothetical protein
LKNSTLKFLVLFFQYTEVSNWRFLFGPTSNETCVSSRSHQLMKNASFLNENHAAGAEARSVVEMNESWLGAL